MRRARSLLAATLLALCCSCGGQRADPNFHPAVAEPAFRGQAPRVTYDEGHRNAHTAGGRYRPFVELLRRDGYRVSRGTRQFSALTLANTDLLVIVNAAGGKVYKIGALELPTRSKRERDHPAFRADEIAAVRDWVRAGGSLLLIADHMPFPGSVANLADAFGVVFLNGYAKKSASEGGTLIFTRAGGLADHPIVRGRDASEEVTALKAFTGQAFRAVVPVAPLMRMPPDWAVFYPYEAGEFTSTTPAESARGLVQGAVLHHGQGRVAVFGEAAMFSAQSAINGDKVVRMGMNDPEASQNAQFVLNVVHWLSGLLPD